MTCVPLVQTVPKEAGVNIMILPSNFSSNMNLFLEKANWILAEFQKHRPFDVATGVRGLNIWAVTEEIPGDNGQHCWYNCSGIDRLMCCDQTKFTQLASGSCGTGFHSQLLVVNNFDRYGAAGGKGMATTSINVYSAVVAVHELGHSLFGLADEYASGAGDATSPNCAAAGCAKWQDLIAAGMPGVGCIPSCKGGAYFTSELTIMDALDAPFGEVSERVSCCKYLFHGYMPAYCTKFNSGAATPGNLNLNTFCTNNIWAGATPVSPMLLLQVGSKEHLAARAADPQGEQQVYVIMPQLWSLEKLPTGNWSCTLVKDLPAGLYRKEKVEGELNDVSHGMRTTNAVKSAKILLNIVKATPESAVHKASLRELVFHDMKNIEVPAELSRGASGKTKGRWTVSDVAVPRTQISVILKRGEMCEVAGIK